MYVCIFTCEFCVLYMYMHVHVYTLMIVHCIQICAHDYAIFVQMAHVLKCFYMFMMEVPTTLAGCPQLTLIVGLGLPSGDRQGSGPTLCCKFLAESQK